MRREHQSCQNTQGFPLHTVASRKPGNHSVLFSMKKEANEIVSNYEAALWASNKDIKPG